MPLLLILPLRGVIALAQPPATGLQQRMSSVEFKAAGLDKLSPRGLQNPDTWLRTHTKTTTKMVDSSGKPVFYADESKRQKIFAHIKGTHQWPGWQQRIHPEQPASMEAGGFRYRIVLDC